MTSLASSKQIDSINSFPTIENIEDAEDETQTIEETRSEFVSRLRKAPFLTPTEDTFKHGRLFSEVSLPQPECIWKSDKPPRDDHDHDSWLTASEYSDTPEALKLKIKTLANLIRVSNKTVLYTGAGISASVVGQAARSGQNTVGWKPGNIRCVKPTFTHRACSHISKLGLLHGWVNQNHDGLPQKAGFPEELINDVHGSWYDPSNPVVVYSGNLKTCCFTEMEDLANTADLVIVLGTSLGGLNADQCASKPAARSLQKRGDGCLGTVCINLQQTPLDGSMSLRLFGKSDDILRLLLAELGVNNHEIKEIANAKLYPKTSRVLVPYDKNGDLLPGGVNNKTDRWMFLDLTDNAQIKLTDGHNCQGSGQPHFIHIGRKFDINQGNGKIKKVGPGNGHVQDRVEREGSFRLNIEGALMHLGIWWLDCAQRGAVDKLPIVNRNPDMWKAGFGG